MRANHKQMLERLSRRQLLRIGGVGSLNLTLPRLLQAEAEKTAKSAKSTSRDYSPNPLVHPYLLLRRSKSYRYL